MVAITKQEANKPINDGKRRGHFMSVYTESFNALCAIMDEREFQDEKHGNPDKNPHTIGAWLLTIEAELAEAKTACIKGGEGRDNVISEIVQIAALCVACLEQHGTDPLPGRTL